MQMPETPQAPAAPAIPTMIGGRYRVLRELGRGGVGTVYLVSHALTNERFALKVLHGNIEHSEEAVSRFEREMRMPAAIRSPHVVKVTDAGSAPELGGALFMVMELLDGMDLHGVLGTRVRMTGEEVLWTLNQVRRGLEKIHAEGLVHRDLKPENMFIHRREEGGLIVKILDFGLVRQSQAAAGIGGGAQLTRNGSIVGTPLYVSPEQVRCETIGPQTDIWALGMITYELLTGKAYWETNHITAIIMRVAQGNLKPPSEQSPGIVSSAFDDWFLRACARDPKARFQSLAEQLTALAGALGLPSVLDETPPPPALLKLLGVEPSITAVVEHPPPPLPRRRNVPLWSALLILLLLALVVTGLILRRPIDRAAPPAADTAPPPVSIPKTAPPPTEKKAPLATPQPPRGDKDDDARTQKRRKKTRDPLSFDPAAP